jgi:hypothetical protein
LARIFATTGGAAVTAGGSTVTATGRAVTDTQHAIQQFEAKALGTQAEAEYQRSQ